MTVLDQFRLDGKVAVVTGGTGLYGRPFARALAEAGATVVVTSRTLERAEHVAGELGTSGRVVGLQLDQGRPDSIERFRDSLIEACGQVDVLVNNAVHRQGRELVDTSAADWDATSAVNSRGLFLLTQAIGAEMMARGAGGSVINIGSIYGLVGPDFPVYEGTSMTSPAFYAYDKAGMVGLTRYLASLLGPHRIRVNCLCPGGLGSPDHDPSFIREYERRTPLRRMATETDAVGALVFLASDAAAYVTGAALPVDGGWTAR